MFPNYFVVLILSLAFIFYSSNDDSHRFNLGFETSVMPWDNLRNVRGWAQVVAEARSKGYPCLGMIDVSWIQSGKRRGAAVGEPSAMVTLRTLGR